MAINDLLPELRKAGRKALVKFLLYIKNIENDSIYAVITKTAEKLEKTMEEEDALRAAVRLHKEGLDPLLVEEREGSDLEDSEEEGEDSEESSDSEGGDDADDEESET